MSQKLDRQITVYIEDLVNVQKKPDESQTTSIKITHQKRELTGGEYVNVPTEDTDVAMALTESLAMALSKSDAVVDEAMENGVAICNIMMTKLAKLLHLDEDDIPKLMKGFKDIPEELLDRVQMLAPLYAEFKNRN